MTSFVRKGNKMAKPRHHTLQGICQDLCVNYQQVVEVLRRIRAVCLEENGKVITQEAGTFFCRNVSGRSGVLNGVPWTSEPFIELGLKGERSNGVHPENDPPLASNLAMQRVFIPLHRLSPQQTSDTPAASFTIRPDGVFTFDDVNPDTGVVTTLERTPFTITSNDPIEPAPVGISSVMVRLSVSIVDSLQQSAFTAGGPYFEINGTPLSLGESFALGAVEGTYSIEPLPDFNLFELGQIRYTLEITMVRGFA